MKIKYIKFLIIKESVFPIFLRYKRIYNITKGEYVYQFLGLHSSRDP